MECCITFSVQLLCDDDEPWAYTWVRLLALWPVTWVRQLVLQPIVACKHAGRDSSIPCPAATACCCCSLLLHSG